MSNKRAADTFEEFATEHVNESSTIENMPDELDIHNIRKLIGLGLIPSGEEYEDLPFYRKRFRWMAMNANSAHAHVQHGEYDRAEGELRSLIMSANIMLKAVQRAADNQKNDGPIEPKIDSV